MADLAVVSVTLGEINKRAAGTFFTPKLFSNGTKRLVRFLAHFG